MGVQSCNHSSWEAEAEGSGIKGQLLSFGKDIFNIYHEIQFITGNMFQILDFLFLLCSSFCLETVKLFQIRFIRIFENWS